MQREAVQLIRIRTGLELEICWIVRISRCDSGQCIAQRLEARVGQGIDCNRANHRIARGGHLGNECPFRVILPIHLAGAGQGKELRYIDRFILVVIIAVIGWP